MIRSEMIFRVAVTRGCPCYRKGDEFRISGNALLLELCDEKSFVTSAVVNPPFERKTCRVIIADFTRLLIENQSIDRVPYQRLECSGCSGKLVVTPKLPPMATTPSNSLRTRNIDQVAGLLGKFSIFQSLDRDNLRQVIALLDMKKYPRDSLILKKGAPAQNLYILVSGSVAVLDENGVCLSTLRKGDVFGEMSLISGEPVGATVKVVEPVSVLMIRGGDFQELLSQFPSIQMYLARLLAQRLAKSNLLVAEEIATSMNGNLEEMPAVEVLQTLHLNQKTGTLALVLDEQRAEVVFRNGELIDVNCGRQQGREAFYALLQEKGGRFRFQPHIDRRYQKTAPIGPFMELLLQGLKCIDDPADPTAAACAKSSF